MASTINSSTSNGIVITPDTSGEIELQANGVTKAKVTANGLQDANGASLRGGMYRNLIINGDQSVAQRGTSATGKTTSGYYTCDRWYNVFSGAGTWTFTQDTDVPSGQGFSSSLKMDCTTANASIAAADSFQLQTRLEGQNLQQLKKGTANAESVTLSFWVKSNKTGTYQVNLDDRDNTRIIGKTYSVDAANTWEKKTLTFAGDTTGAFDNDNNASLRLVWWFASGSNYNTGSVPTSWETLDITDVAAGLTVNLADSTSNYINITGVQLEVGSGASDFEFLPYDVQLARCQRYYYRIGSPESFAVYAGINYHTSQSIAVGIVFDVDDAYFHLTMPEVMRGGPSVSNNGYLVIASGNGGVSTLTQNICTLQATYNTGRRIIQILVDCDNTLTGGQPTMLYFFNSAGYLEFDAEL